MGLINGGRGLPVPRSRFGEEVPPRNGNDDVPPDLWEECPRCKQFLYVEDIRPLRVCDKCGYHYRLGVQERLQVTLDEGTFESWGEEIEPRDPLGFPGYAEKIVQHTERSGASEAILVGRGQIEQVDVAIGVMNLAFIGGSMGVAVGERVALLMERAAEMRLPVVVFCASGGARMQESLISLMQMPKTCAAVGRLGAAGMLYISVLADPTYGGVAASYAFLGDIIIAEPGAAMGFAGPRVIEVTRLRIGPAVQTAEFQYGHGMIDLLVPRHQMRPTLARLLRWARGAGTL